jgi:hypothetical protein
MLIYLTAVLKLMKKKDFSFRLALIELKTQIRDL